MEAIRAFETNLIIFLQSLGPALQTVMRGFTWLGDAMFFMLFMPAIYWCVDALAGLRIGMLLLLSNSLNGIFKMLGRGPRPYWVSAKVQPLVHEKSFGIPSGHAMNATSVWGGVAREARQRWVTILCVALVLLVSFSRLVLGVHFISDVLAGLALGGLLLLVFARLRAPVSKWFWGLCLRNQLLVSLASSLLLLGVALLVRLGGSTWVMPSTWAALAGETAPFSREGALTASGMWLGMLGGFAILRVKHGILQSAEGQWEKLARYLLGILGMMVLYFGLARLLGSLSDQIGIDWATAALSYLHNTLLGVWVSLLAPLLFKSLKLARFEPMW